MVGGCSAASPSGHGTCGTDRKAAQWPRHKDTIGGDPQRAWRSDWDAQAVPSTRSAPPARRRSCCPASQDAPECQDAITTRQNLYWTFQDVPHSEPSVYVLRA
jgi:hypothetical protein